MTYAFILLALVAALTWSAWSGLSIPEIGTGNIREKIMEVYENTKERAYSAIKNKAKEELHEAIDQTFDK